MKKNISIVLILLGVFIISGYILLNRNKQDDQSPTNIESNGNVIQVSIQNFAYSPQTLTVKKGTTVVWTNNDTVIHDVVSNSFASGKLAKGETFRYTFDKEGTVDYICSYHPAMVAKVIVE